MAVPTSTIIKGAMNTGITSLTGGVIPSDLIIRLFADFQDYLEPTETPFTSSIDTGKPVNQKKVEWLTGFLVPNQVTLGGSYTATATTLTLTAGDGAKVMPTDLLKIDAEIFWVVSFASADVVNIKFAMGGTTNANHANGATVEILGPAALENADTPIAPWARGAIEWNGPQRMDFGVQIDNRANVTPDYEFRSANQYDEILEKKMVEAAIFFEKTAILGRRGTEAAMTGANATPTTMGGLDFFTDQATDMLGAPITYSNLMDVLQNLYQRIDKSHFPDTWFMGPAMKRAVSSLYPHEKIANVNDTKTTLKWSSVETDFGDMKFTISRYIPAGSMYLVKLSDITKHPYKGGEWTEVALPANGPYKKGRFTGDYTIVFRNNAARWKIVNASTAKADYPGM